MHSKVEILTSANNLIKKSYDSTIDKLKKIESENYIIPKKNNEEEKNAGDSA